MGKLDGKVAIVTGTSSGLGRGVAIAFAKEGAKLAICARRVEKLQQTAETCRQAGAEVLALPCDVTVMADLERLVNTTMEKYGRIDILVNNAVSATQYVSIMDHTQDMWDSVMKSGLEASWNLMRLCQPIMKKQKYGRIINVSSAAGYQGMALYGAYAIAKAGIRAMTMVAAREWGPEITVNSFGPLCNSDLSSVTFGKMPQADADTYIPPLGYVGDPEKDLAPGMVFLASDDGHYVTGQQLNVDGGLEIHF